MEKITILSRSDDLGSSLSANCAIERVVDAGFTCIQIRSKEVGARELIRLCREAADIIAAAGKSDVITRDKKTMIADAFVLWHISDPVRFTRYLNGQLAQAQSRISASVFSSLRVSRNDPWATSWGRPIARSTWLGSNEPEVQAEPELAQMPA